MKSIKIYQSLSDFLWSMAYTFLSCFGLAIVAWYNSNPAVDIVSYFESGAILGVVVTAGRLAIKGTVEWFIPNIKIGLQTLKEYIDSKKVQ